MSRITTIDEAAPKRSLVHAPFVFECTVLPPVNSISVSCVCPLLYGLWWWMTFLSFLTVVALCGWLGYQNNMVPRAILKRGRRRRISLEVHKVENSFGEAGKRHLHSYEECIVRILTPESKEEHRESLRRGRARMGNNDDEDDVNDEASISGQSVAVSTMTGLDEVYYGANADLTATVGWKLSLVVEIKFGRRRDVREIIFDTQEDADSFEALLNKEIDKVRERSNEKLRAILGSTSPSAPLTESMKYLIEIVSARDLPIADIHKQSSDPFVICLFNEREVHRTEMISSNLNPIWTVETDSLFIFTATIEELFRSNGILCIVYDYDLAGANDRLGEITIEPETIFKGNGNRLEYKLNPPPGKSSPVSGYLAIRVRLATDHDKQFMEDRMASKTRARKIEANSIEFQQGGASNIASVIARRQRKRKDGTMEFKVRPGPDLASAEREEQTKWMTNEALQQETLKESREWVDCGSGSLGRLFVEVLGCDDLPNLDAGGFAGNKTDAFCSLVFEDVAVKTDIIDDCLFPRWMPWTKRAFIFHIYYSSSQLYLGVFDHDKGITPADNHDLVGRVSVDLSNLRKDTLYTLTYNLYTTALMTDRKRKGTITIRLRLEIDDERKVVFSALEPPPQMYVNVKSPKDFQVIRSTVYGKVDMRKYNQKVINSYIDEILALQHASFYLYDGLKSLILWRGSLTFKDFFVVWFPLHSFANFVALTHVVENPNLLPSFLFASLAWLLIATMTYRQSLPDLWDRCKGYGECGEAVIFGNSKNWPQMIRPNENAKKAEEYYESWKKRIEDSETAATIAYEEQLRAQREHEKEIPDYTGGDVDLANRKEGVSIDPFKPFLFPIQQCLAVLCRYVRHTKHILTWQECYIAFWVTSACAVLSVLCAFIPWLFIVKWSTRLVVWVLFGPWMKLVDIFYVSKIKPLTLDEHEEKKLLDRKRRQERTFAAVAQLRVKQENRVKLKAMKTHLFGKFIIRVPLLKEERYRDLPLPQSHAEPFIQATRSLAKTAMLDAGYHKTFIPSQHLVGDMIPCAETVGFTEASTGQPIAHPSRAEKRVVGTSSSSTHSAYIRIASSIIAPAIVTLVTFPALASAAEQMGWFLSGLIVECYNMIKSSKPSTLT